MRPLVILSLGLLLIIQVAPAQQPLTVSECIRIGLENSRSLHASLMKVRAADARVSEANAARLPSLKLSGTYTRLSEIAPFEVALPFPPPAPSTFTISPSILNNYNARLTLQQPLFTGLRLESSADLARHGAQAAQQDYSRDRADLVYNIQAAYWGLFKAVEIRKVLDENVSQVEAHLRDAQNLHRQGLITYNEALKVQVQLSSARLAQIHAKNAVRLATVALNNLIGLPLETEVALASKVERQPRRFADLAPLLQKALESRPEIQAMEHRLKAGEAGVALARSGQLPQIYLIGNYAYARPNPRLLPAQDRFKGTWDVGVAVSLDLWNWRTTAHQTGQARAQLLQAQDALAQIRDGIRLEVTQQFLNLLEAEERIGVAEQGVKQAEENHRVTSARFKAGLALNSDLLDAEVALLQARTNHTQTLVDYELAQAGLQRVIGQ